MGQCRRTPWVALAPVLWLAGLAALGAFDVRAPGPGSPVPAPDRGPNLLLVVVDDLGWRDLGVSGSTRHRTPVIDGLAAEGARCLQAYSVGPNCAPSRASLHTGRHTARHGILTVAPSARGRAEDRRVVPPPTRRTLRPGTRTLAADLRDLGYDTGHVGKWHLSEDPTDFGFDFAVGGSTAGHPPAGYHAPFRLPGLEGEPAGAYLTDAEGRAARRFLDREREGPWFLHLAFHAVHTPVQAPAGAAEAFAARHPDLTAAEQRYGAMVERVDHVLGEVLAHVRSRGELGDTVVLVTSDNGGVDRFCDLAPLRGEKGSLYQAGVRVPWIVRAPGRVPAGRELATPVTHLDLRPTLLEWAGAPAPASGSDAPDGAAEVRDGISLVAWLAGEAALPERTLYWHFPCYLEGRDRTWRTTPASTLRRGSWVLHEFLEDGRLELYDLARDPGERNDLAEQHPERARRLAEDLAAWRRELEAPMPSGPEPRHVPR